MPDFVVISDASTVIGLLNIDCLELLHKLYKEVIITTIVKEEINVDLPEWVKVDDGFNELVFRSLLPSLDQGEASSIALALSKEHALLIIDERKGRHRARSLGLTITGIVGIIIKAKNEGIITSGKKQLDLLIENGFRLSEKV